MNPDLNEIVPPRKLRRSPVRESGIPAPPQNSSTASRIRPPSGYTASRNLLQVPAGRLRPPTQIRQPRLRPPGSQLRPPGGTEIPTPWKVIPLPGSPDKLAPIPNPLRLAEPSPRKSRIPAPGAVRVASTSLLPKPACFQPSASKIVPPTIFVIPPGSPVRLVPKTPMSIPRPQTAPAATTTPSSVRTMTPARKVPTQTPRSTVKRRTIVKGDDPAAELHHIAGRDVEFIDYVPSPEAQPAPPKSVRKPVARPGQASARIAKGLVRSAAGSSDSPEEVVEVTRAPPAREPKPKKIHEFADEPSVAAAKEFASHISADLQRFKDMGADMSQLKSRKAAVMSRIALMRTREGQEGVGLDMEVFRAKYGITQSPNMRQLLELTGEWNRVILEKRELAERMAQAQRFSLKVRPKRVSTLEDVSEIPDGSPLDTLRSELRLARKERIDNYRQRKQIETEYRRMMEERKKNIASRRPYSKEEREEIRKRYQEAQQWNYTTPTEEELDAALKWAEVMELEQAGLSATGSPEKMVDALFPGAIHSAEITGKAGSIPIPLEIPLEDMNTVKNLDRDTAEVALKAGMISAPAEGTATTVLKTCLDELTNKTVEPIAQHLDPMYEIDLELGRPKRQNFVQLQGSAFPAWFPGFYSIFPGSPGLVQAQKSPSSTLLTAWRKIQPSVASAI